MVLQIGKYNLDACGRTGDKLEYQTLIVSEFDKNEKEINRKRFYILTDRGIVSLLDILAQFEESDIDELMKRPKNTKLTLVTKTHFEIIRKGQ